MALIERFLVGDDTKIPAHLFFAINVQRIDGALTRQQVIDLLVLGPTDVTEYDTLAAQAPTGTTTNARLGQFLFLNKVHSVLIMNELKISGYVTAAEVRTKLGL